MSEKKAGEIERQEYFSIEEWHGDITARLKQLRPDDPEYAGLLEEKNWIESGSEDPPKETLAQARERVRREHKTNKSPRKLIRDNGIDI